MKRETMRTLVRLSTLLCVASMSGCAEGSVDRDSSSEDGSGDDGTSGDDASQADVPGSDSEVPAGTDADADADGGDSPDPEPGADGDGGDSDADTDTDSESETGTDADTCAEEIGMCGCLAECYADSDCSGGGDCVCGDGPCYCHRCELAGGNL